MERGRPDDLSSPARGGGVPAKAGTEGARPRIHLTEFRRQHPIKAYVADFACIEARPVIELDGATRSTAAEREHDEIRETVFKREGWRIPRFNNAEVAKNLYQTLQVISRSARCAPSAPDFVRDTSPASGGGKPSEKE